MSPKDENRDQDLSKSRDYSKMLQACPFNLQNETQTQDARTPTISFSQSNDTLRRYNLQMIQSSLSEFSRLRAHTSSTLREIQNATHTKRTHLFNSIANHSRRRRRRWLIASGWRTRIQTGTWSWCRRCSTWRRKSSKCSTHGWREAKRRYRYTTGT